MSIVHKVIIEKKEDIEETKCDPFILTLRVLLTKVRRNTGVFLAPYIPQISIILVCYPKFNSYKDRNSFIPVTISQKIKAWERQLREVFDKIIHWLKYLFTVGLSSWVAVLLFLRGRWVSVWKKLKKQRPEAENQPYLQGRSFVWKYFSYWKTLIPRVIFKDTWIKIKKKKKRYWTYFLSRSLG